MPNWCGWKPYLSRPGQTGAVGNRAYRVGLNTVGLGNRTYRGVRKCLFTLTQVATCRENIGPYKFNRAYMGTITICHAELSGK